LRLGILASDKNFKEGVLMKRLVVLLGMICLALLLVGSCGKQEEPAKAQKPAASTPAPAKEPAAPAPKAAEAKPGAAQPAPATPTSATPAPEKK